MPRRTLFGSRLSTEVERTEGAVVPTGIDPKFRFGEVRVAGLLPVPIKVTVKGPSVVFKM
jgi:hypothetical protein